MICPDRSRSVLLGLRAFCWISLPQAVGNELREGLPRRLPPTNAKRMPGRVGVYLVAFGSLKISSCLEQSRAESDGLFMRSARIIHMQVQMHLLGNDPMRPVGRNMVRRQLHADSPLSSGVNDAVPIVVLEDVPAEKASPERALGV